MHAGSCPCRTLFCPNEVHRVSTRETPRPNTPVDHSTRYNSAPLVNDESPQRQNYRSHQRSLRAVESMLVTIFFFFPFFTLHHIITPILNAVLRHALFHFHRSKQSIDHTALSTASLHSRKVCTQIFKKSQIGRRQTRAIWTDTTGRITARSRQVVGNR